jgi:hypothetical protein
MAAIGWEIRVLASVRPQHGTEELATKTNSLTTRSQLQVSLMTCYDVILTHDDVIMTKDFDA